MHSLTSALNGGEWSASRLDYFTPRERSPATHWIGGWVGSRTVLNAVVKREIPSLRRESNLRTPIVQPVAQSVPTELSRPYSTYCLIIITEMAGQFPFMDPTIPQTRETRE
jgi:hypothetical protein